MNYIGSKLSLIDFIKDSITSTLERRGDNRAAKELHVMDLFAGTCVVGASFKQAGYHVSGNDLQYYSYVMCRHKLETTFVPQARAQELLKRLRETPGEQGFIYSNYSKGGTQNAEHVRMYFSDENAAKCDGMRLALDDMRARGDISEDEFFFLLATILVSMDRVANTASVYGAFLKQLKRSAQKPLELVPAAILPGTREYHAYNEEGVALAARTQGDILYLDPPYNSRQYSSNYHMLETIARYDAPRLRGQTGLRADDSGQKSDFCSVARVGAALESLVRDANYRYIFLSYNNEGLLPLESIREVMSRYGDYDVSMRAYRRFKADKDENRNHRGATTTEYLHSLVKW